LLDQKEEKLKAERSFCPQAFTLARRSAKAWLFLFVLLFCHPELVEGSSPVLRLRQKYLA
jgi:hypothetical protein